MKKYITCIFALFIVAAMAPELSAQKAAIRTANKLYELKAYAQAIPYYEYALKKNKDNSQALVNIADCYRLTNDSKRTMQYYARVINLPAATPVYTYYYAQALMQNGDYNAALKYMSEYKNDDRGAAFEKAIARISTFYKDTAYYRIKEAAFNSSENDFSPVLLNDGKVVFASARNHTQWVSYTHKWTDWKYYTMYITHKDELGNYTKPKRYERRIQIRFNDGPVCLDNDGKTIYITRNNFKKNKVARSKIGEVNSSIYRAEYDAQKKRFINLQGFDFNSNEYNTAHPAISADGTKLYFSSDMPGGQGGMDIWVTTKTAGGWGKPENLGDKLNSPGDEVFPYVFNKKTLYFSSNGYDGIGGLDIFSIKLNNDGMPGGAAKNIGAPINSSADDFGIAIYTDGRRGFFSSNRMNHNLDDNIYEFTSTKPDKLPYTILVMDSITRKLIESNIVIVDNENSERREYTETSGTYVMDLYPESAYTISANANEYKPKANINFNTPADNNNPFEILLAPVDKYFIAGTVYELFDDLPTKSMDSAIVFIKDESGSIVCTTYITDVSGKYHSCDLKPNTKYTVTATKAGYFAKSSVVKSIPPGGIIRDFYLKKIVINKPIVIQNIYFDLDKSFIRPDAATELDSIVLLLNDNPNIIIELSSHTDCRASYQYNMSLSDRRAKASAAYIVSKGIDPIRITGKGYGESKLVNDCKCEGKVKSNCTEEEHQQNRRTEFKVTGFVKGTGNVNVKSTPKLIN